jgi:hypothetical protein
MGCDCVPYKVNCVGEVMYCAGTIEGAGMANSVAIVMIDLWFRRKYYWNELVAKVIRVVAEWGVVCDNVQPWGGASSSLNADGSGRHNKDNKDESKVTRKDR